MKTNRYKYKSVKGVKKLCDEMVEVLNKLNNNLDKATIIGEDMCNKMDRLISIKKALHRP